MTRQDPLRKFRYYLEIDSIEQAGFSGAPGVIGSQSPP